MPVRVGVARDSSVRLTPTERWQTDDPGRSTDRKASMSTRTSSWSRGGWRERRQPRRGRGGDRAGGGDPAAAPHRRRGRGRLAAVRFSWAESDRRRGARAGDRRAAAGCTSWCRRRARRPPSSTRSMPSSGGGGRALAQTGLGHARAARESSSARSSGAGGWRSTIRPKGAIPYLDGVPAGVAELLRGLGATLVSSVGSGDPILLGDGARRTSPRTSAPRRRSRPSRVRR